MQDSNRPLPRANDMTNLIELGRILVKRKFLVLLIPVLTLLAASAFLLVTPSVFESRAVLQVGQILQIEQIGQGGQIRQIEAPSILVRRLKEQYRVGEMGAITEMPRVTAISMDMKDAGTVITILAQDHSAKGAQVYLAQVMQTLMAEHARLYNQAMDIQRQCLQPLDEQMRALDDQVVNLSAQIEAVRKQDPAQAAIVALEKGNLFNEKIGLQHEIINLHLALSNIQSQPSKLLREPTLPASRVKPKRSVILSLAMVLGVLLGLFAAFITEFFFNVRK